MIDFTKVDDWVYYLFKYVAIAALLVLAFFIARSYFEQDNDREEIMENKAFVKGEIIYYGHSGITDHTVKYVYEVDGKKYENQHGVTLLPCATVTDFSGCIGLKYWVIYSKLNPNKSGLLATAHDYEWYGLKVPEGME